MCTIQQFNDLGVANCLLILTRPLHRTLNGLHIAFGMNLNDLDMIIYLHYFVEVSTKDSWQQLALLARLTCKQLLNILDKSLYTFLL